MDETAVGGSSHGGEAGNKACKERGKEAMPAPPLVVKVHVFLCQNDAGMANT